MRFFALLILGIFYSLTATESHHADHQPQLRGTMHTFKTLINDAYHEDWGKVQPILEEYRWDAFPEKTRNIVQVIKREMERATAKSATETKEENHDQQIIAAVHATFFSPKQEQQPSSLALEQQVDDYYQHSRVYHFVDDEGKKIIKQALLAKGKMPEVGYLKECEHFFWDCNDKIPTSRRNVQKILKALYSNPYSMHPLQWSQFEDFCAPYRQHNAFATPMVPEVMVDCLSIYLIYLSSNWEVFMEFCKPNLYSFQDGYSRLLTINTLLPIYQAFHGDLEEINTFKKFCDSVWNEISGYYDERNLELLSIYQKFHDQARLKDDLINFCRPYLQEKEGYAKKLYLSAPEELQSIGGLRVLLKAYAAFTDPIERDGFINFCTQYKTDPLNQTDKISALLYVYQTFTDPTERRQFINFCSEYEASEDSYAMSKLLPVYQAFHGDPIKLKEFISFCSEHGKTTELRKYPRELAEEMADLLSIYQAFHGDPIKLKEFMNFCSPYNRYKHAVIMIKLLPIYQYYLDDFEQFVSRHGCDKTRLISTYIPRTYLRYERALAALQTQNDRTSSYALYETKLNEQLPVINPADPHIAQVRGIQATANAHEFDPYYPIDYALLKAWCNDQEYAHAPAQQEHVIHNGDQSLNNYQTNQEVADFIRYLDKIAAGNEPINKMPPARAVSLVKQMLGLEPKAEDTTGRFAPYLGHSMDYRKNIGENIIGADGNTYVVESGDEVLVASGIS